MAKGKKQKKLSRRQRQQAAASSSVAPRRQAPIAEPAPEQTPLAETTEAPAAPSAPGPVTATFTKERHRVPDGIDADLAAMEYPAVRSDLRRLGITLIVFLLLLAGLAWVGNATTVLDDLGHSIFKLWS